VFWKGFKVMFHIMTFTEIKIVTRERFLNRGGEAENIKYKFRFCPKIAKHLYQPVISRQ